MSSIGESSYSGDWRGPDDDAEPEVLFPVTCPICARETLTGFRFSVVKDAFSTGQIRLYADCHVVSWDGSEQELLAMREYLDTVWGTGLQKGCEDFFLLDQFLNADSLSFIYTGVLDPQEIVDTQVQAAREESLNAELTSIVERTLHSPLNKAEYAKLKSAIDQFVLSGAIKKPVSSDERRILDISTPKARREPAKRNEPTGGCGTERLVSFVHEAKNRPIPELTYLPPSSRGRVI